MTRELVLVEPIMRREEAATYCAENYNGYLLSINSAEEQTVAANLCGDGVCHLGLWNNAQNNPTTFDDGTPVTYTNWWWYSEPDGGSSDPAQLCCQFRGALYPGESAGSWWTYDCPGSWGNNVKTICEFAGSNTTNPTTEPTAEPTLEPTILYTDTPTMDPTMNPVEPDGDQAGFVNVYISLIGIMMGYIAFV